MRSVHGKLQCGSKWMITGWMCIKSTNMTAIHSAWTPSDASELSIAYVPDLSSCASVAERAGIAAIQQIKYLDNMLPSEFVVNISQLYQCGSPRRYRNDHVPSPSPSPSLPCHCKAAITRDARAVRQRVQGWVCSDAVWACSVDDYRWAVLCSLWPGKMCPERTERFFRMPATQPIIVTQM